MHTQIIRHAVSGMLPKNKLRERRLARLRIFEGPDAGPFAQNVLRRNDASNPSPFSSLADSSPPATAAKVEKKVKTREVDPKLLEAWQEIATAQKWEAPSSLATAKST
jgi:hypothetical protein